MRDYLCHIADLAAEAKTVELWASNKDGEWVFHLPPLCDALMLEAYTDLGTLGDENGEGGEPPMLASGHWIIVSIGNGNPIPEVVAPYVVAEGSREDGLTLPVGVAGLSTMWAGMSVRPSTPTT